MRTWRTGSSSVEAVIERVGRCTWRLDPSEFGDALAGHDRAHLEAVIERVWTSTWRQSVDRRAGC